MANKALLAQFILFLLGIAVKSLNKHWRYQANSIKYRNVLSYQYLGLRAFKDKKLLLKMSDWVVAYKKMHELMTEATKV